MCVSLQCGHCPLLRLSDPVLLPGPGGRGEEGKLPECELWASQGLSLLCVSLCGLWGVGGVGQGSWLAAATIFCLGFTAAAVLPPLGVTCRKGTGWSHTALL
jgi:hypothetical protein